MLHRKFYLLIFTAAALLLLGCRFASLIAPPTATFTPVPPTDTPEPTPTPEPTATPADPAGFQKFETSDFEIWLPNSYIGSNLSEDLDTIISTLEDLGPEFEQTAEMLAQNPDFISMYAFDSNLGPINFLTNVVISSITVLKSMPMQMILDASASSLSEEIMVISTNEFMINGYPAGLIELAYEFQGVSIHQLLYYILHENTAYAVTFTTTEAEYAQRLPDFETSINTFKVND